MLAGLSKLFAVAASNPIRSQGSSPAATWCLPVQLDSLALPVATPSMPSVLLPPLPSPSKDKEVLWLCRPAGVGEEGVTPPVEGPDVWFTSRLADSLQTDQSAGLEKLVGKAATFFCKVACWQESGD